MKEIFCWQIIREKEQKVLECLLQFLGVSVRQKSPQN